MFNFCILNIGMRSIPDSAILNWSPILNFPYLQQLETSVYAWLWSTFVRQWTCTLPFRWDQLVSVPEPGTDGVELFFFCRF
jgi:hypothetical protein